MLLIPHKVKVDVKHVFANSQYVCACVWLGGGGDLDTYQWTCSFYYLIISKNGEVWKELLLLFLTLLFTIIICI